mmetsp:Transcript_8358/g.25052  ORF Transcript_8358/g.25052 Transcript_8358/m.25052 type:complete len:221 (-) Transcript_8358:1097-1759(-)
MEASPWEAVWWVRPRWRPRSRSNEQLVLGVLGPDGEEGHEGEAQQQHAQLKQAVAAVIQLPGQHLHERHVQERAGGKGADGGGAGGGGEAAEQEAQGDAQRGGEGKGGDDGPELPGACLRVHYAGPQGVRRQPLVCLDGNEDVKAVDHVRLSAQGGPLQQRVERQRHPHQHRRQKRHLRSNRFLDLEGVRGATAAAAPLLLRIISPAVPVGIGPLLQLLL